MGGVVNGMKSICGRWRRLGVLLVVVVCGAVCARALGQTTRPSKRDAPKPAGHTTRNIEGWTVRIDNRLLSDPDRELGERAIKLLSMRMAEIVWNVPGDKVKWLR